MQEDAKDQDALNKDYFRKLVDVQFDSETVFKSNAAFLKPLKDESVDHALPSRRWLGILRGQDQATPENIAKLETFHEHVRGFVVRLKETFAQEAQGAGPEVAARLADVRFDFEKVRQAHEELNHHYRNMSGGLLGVLDLMEETKEVGGELRTIARTVYRQAQKTHDEIVTSVTAQAAALGFTPFPPETIIDSAALDKFHTDVRDAVERLKDNRMQAEYELADRYAVLMKDNPCNILKPRPL